MRDKHRDWIDIDCVAFPQTGVMVPARSSCWNRPYAMGRK